MTMDPTRWSVKNKFRISGDGVLTDDLKLKLNAFRQNPGQLSDGHVDLSYFFCPDCFCLVQYHAQDALGNRKFVHGFPNPLFFC